MVVSKYPPCADCGHDIGFHDPCSLCAGEGRTCREYVTMKTKQKADRKPKRASKPTKKRRR